MEPEELHLGSDELSVLQYLNSWPGEFVPELQISRRADDKRRFVEEPNWARNALNHLRDLELVEFDGVGRYRVKIQQPATAVYSKFMAPHLKEILMRSDRKFDLSSYAP